VKLEDDELGRIIGDLSLQVKNLPENVKTLTSIKIIDKIVSELKKSRRVFTSMK